VAHLEISSTYSIANLILNEKRIDQFLSKNQITHIIGSFEQIMYEFNYYSSMEIVARIVAHFLLRKLAGYSRKKSICVTSPFLDGIVRQGTPDDWDMMEPANSKTLLPPQPRKLDNLQIRKHLDIPTKPIQ
jgi:hypothetical protein